MELSQECCFTEVLPHLGILGCQDDLGFLLALKYNAPPFQVVPLDRRGHVDLGFLDRLLLQEVLEQASQGNLVLQWALRRKMKCQEKREDKSKFKCIFLM